MNNTLCENPQRAIFMFVFHIVLEIGDRVGKYAAHQAENTRRTRKGPLFTHVLSAPMRQRSRQEHEVVLAH